MSAKKSKKNRLELKEIRKKNKRIYLLLFFLGCASLICTIVLYSKTIINAWAIVFILVISGFVGFLIDYKRYMFSYDLDGFFGYIGAYLQNVMFVGGVVGMLFFGSNYYSTGSNIKSKDYEIINRKSRRPSDNPNRQPVFTIIFEDRKKEFIFPHRYLEEMNEFKTISLKSVEGLWGFDVVLDKKLNK